MMRALAAALLLCGCATLGGTTPSAEPVIAAERAFAADAMVRPTKAAFLTFAADDGVMVRRGEVVNAKAFVATWPEEADAGTLRWWPLQAGIARSGELGFTTGPSINGGERFGTYFTVWRRQPDGAWRWIIDMGGKTPAASTQGPETPVTVVPPSGVAAADAATAYAQVRAIEAEMAQAMASDYRAAHRARLAPDARLFGMEPAAVTGEAAVAAALAARPERITSRPLGGGASAAGDLAYTYGVAEWRQGEAERKGSYLRVWQRRPAGWVIVSDLISGG